VLSALVCDGRSPSVLVCLRVWERARCPPGLERARRSSFADESTIAREGCASSRRELCALSEGEIISRVGPGGGGRDASYVRRGPRVGETLPDDLRFL
jgi:hypothetical protein